LCLEREVHGIGDPYAFTGFIVSVETNKPAELFFESFEAAAKFAEEVAGKHLESCGAEVAIRNVLMDTIESKFGPGLHLPVSTWDARTAAP
jgi:hypothetical protein